MIDYSSLAYFFVSLSFLIFSFILKKSKTQKASNNNVDNKLSLKKG